MIKPSQVNTRDYFWDSSFQNSEREIVARNVTMLNKALAFSRDDDRWQPFTVEDYETFRAATSTEPVGYMEHNIMRGFVTDGYLDMSEEGTYSVTNAFLGVVVKFATPEYISQFIAK